jgi:PilZ domain
VERRKDNRFLLRVPVTFKWNDEQARPHEGSGFSLDISTSGIFVITEVYPPLGAAVEVEVLLPLLRGDAPRRLRLNAPGIVLRVVETEGFASTSDFVMAAKRETGPFSH